MTSLSGRHALVTGASRGIGAGVVRALSAAGARVTLMARDREAATAVAYTLRGPHAIVTADVTDRDAVRAACAEAVGQLGPVDILVNNAGFSESSPFLKTEPAAFERHFQVHVVGAVHLTQAVLPSMLERGTGQVINMASTAGLEGTPYVTAYVAAKHALVGLTRALALEVEPKGVRVNAVCPGYTDTDMVSGAAQRIAQKTGKGEDEVLRSILEAAGQRRLVTVTEIADAVVSLAAEPPGSPSGRTIVLDGSTP